MKVEYSRLLIVLIGLIIRFSNPVQSTARENCHDFAGDRSNCQRFIRCFYNLRVLFTCASATAYVPELQTCVARELVVDCDDSKNRVEITISSNDKIDETEDYPTIEADLNALEVPMQKSLSSHIDVSISPRQFGCSSFCYNKGVCVLVGQSITCRCPPGFIGSRCQIAQSAISTKAGCIPNPCLNGGVCVETSSLITLCVCAAGWTGDLCDYPDGSPITTTTTTTTIGPGIITTTTTTTTATVTNIVLCVVNSCFNGGTCITLPTGGFACICVPGYTGQLCDRPLGTTGIGCGSTNPCLNSGLCVTTAIGSQCQCLGGFGGSFCQTNTALSLLNPCQSSPCRNGGSCYLTSQSTFGCACPTGYTGICCDTVLSATNPCYSNPCLNSGTCQIVGPSIYRCVCPLGLLGVRCEQRLCEPNPCLYGGVCLPYGNSFQCQCPSQYTGRCCENLIVTTAAPNPCSNQPCLNGGTCTATSSTAFVCTCTASYYGRCCELRNYCQPNPCYNAGACISTITAYVCNCQYPFTGSNCETTVSTRATQVACACIICPCPVQTTTATNPCLPNPCQNSGGCAVVQNAAQCYCQPQFTGYYCEFSRKRTLSNALCANVTCLNGGICHVDENGAQCTCPKPYFGDRCELINGPRSCNPNPCYNDGQCISTADGYKCVCKNGKTGILCEQITMPAHYRWCPLKCESGASCVFEGSTPKCRVLNVY